LENLADALCGAPKTFAKEAAMSVLSMIEDLGSKFPVPVHTLQLLLSGVFETEGDLVAASTYHAKAAQVCLDTKAVEDREKIDTLLKAASLFIKIQKGAEASRFLQDCKIKVRSPFKPSQKLLYNQVNAQVMDHEGNYQVAARGHLDVAQDRQALASGQITEAAQLDSIKCAARCTLISPAGERRDGILETLCKDERLTGTLATLVKKAFKCHLLREEDVASLKQEVAPHHAAAVSKAVAEHNVLAASTLYKNISTKELAQLLLVDSKIAEKTAATMIADGRVTGTISQVTGTVAFAAIKDETGVDQSVEGICNVVEELKAQIRVVSASS